jgi:hypothetical protein
MPFRLNAGGQDEQYVLTANPGSGQANIRRIWYEPANDVLLVSVPIWQSPSDWRSGVTVYMPFTLESGGTVIQYFLTASTSSGTVAIRQVWFYAATKTIKVSNPVWARDWDPQYTVYMPFTLESGGAARQYFLTANTTSGSVSIRQIYWDAWQVVQVSEPAWSSKWNPAYTIYMPFTLTTGGVRRQYFLTGNPSSGAFDIRRIHYDASGAIVVDKPAWSASWAPARWLCVPLELNGKQYVLAADNTHGRMQIRPITGDDGRIDVGPPVWEMP